MENPKPIPERNQVNNRAINLYGGFHPLSRIALKKWEGRIIEFCERSDFNSRIETVNEILGSGNLILFFDHHYAFDALPLGLGLSRLVTNISSVIIPYAVHLDMALGREGEPSIRYWLRTKAFQWLKKHIVMGNPQVRFLPVVREFEMNNPRLRHEVDEKFQGISTVYLRYFIRTFSESTHGKVSFLSPFAGIGFPDKPVLHPQVFRSIQMVRGKSRQKISFCITGAYPDWAAYDSYFAPMLMKHQILISKPFILPEGGYDEAKFVVEEALVNLRKSAGFTPPDYEKILLK